MKKLTLLLLLLISCDSATESGPVQPRSNKVPGIGSTYIENNHTMFDSLSTGTVVDVNFTRLGRSNVTRIAFGTASFYLSYEPNGDVSFANDYSLWWTTLPTASKKEIIMPVDTSAVDIWGYYQVTNTAAVRKGTEKLTIGQKEHAAIVVEVQYRGKRYTADHVFQNNQISNMSYWWIPEIGYFGRSRIDQFEPEEHEMQFDLFDYLLRE